MKRMLWLVPVTLVACSEGRVDALPPASARAAVIDQQVSQMRRDTATVFGLSAEGASLEAAYEGTMLRRLRGEFLGEGGRATETFYFDTALFLVVRTELSYDAPSSGRGSDSVTLRFDLAAPETPAHLADSLRSEARALLAHLSADSTAR